MGLEIYDHTKISNFSENRNGVELLTENGKKIKARKLVIACGYESARYIPQKIQSLQSTYAIISEPATSNHHWHQNALIWETARPYFYIRTTADNRIIMGGEDEHFSNARLRDLLLEKKVSKLLKKFKELFPRIDVKPDYYWCGTFGETKDGLPFIGKYPGQEHTYYALGYGGNGITFSVIAAEIIRDLYLGKPSGNEKLFAFRR